MSSGFPVWASKPATTVWFGHLAPKLPRQFLGFDLKIKWATVCQLRHKTDGRRTARDTRRDLATCFTWKQVGLGFSNFASKLVEERWWVVHVASSRRSRGSKAKRWSVRWHRVWHSGSRTNLPFISCNFPFSPKGHSSLLVFAINRLMGLLWEESLSHPLGFRSSFC
jgi:hypothetical protein